MLGQGANGSGRTSFVTWALDQRGAKLESALRPTHLRVATNELHRFSLSLSAVPSARVSLIDCTPIFAPKTARSHFYVIAAESMPCKLDASG